MVCRHYHSSAFWNSFHHNQPPGKIAHSLHSAMHTKSIYTPYVTHYEKTCQKSRTLEFAYFVSTERLRSSRFNRAKITSVFRSILEIRAVLEWLSQTHDSRKSCLRSADSVTSGQSVNFSATRSKVSTSVSVARCSVFSSLRTAAAIPAMQRRAHTEAGKQCHL